MCFSTTFQRVKEFDKHGNIDFIRTPYIPPASHSIWDEILRVFAIYKYAWGKKALMLNASSGWFHPNVLAIVLMNFMPRKKRPLVALVGEMWQPNRGVRGFVENLIIRISDRVIGMYVVHSMDELEIFPARWRIDARKVKYCAYFASISDSDIAKTVDNTNGGHIFAGGNSLRDYEPLVEVAKQMPDHQFIVASRLLNSRTDLPPNLRTGEVPQDEFMELLKTASVVVVSIMKNLSRAAGQQTYLNAMLMRKPVIVTAGPGVSDHIRDRETGLIVSGDVSDFVNALHWLFDEKNKQQVTRMTETAQKLVREKYTKEIHVARLIYLMDEFIAQAGSRSTR